MDLTTTAQVIGQVSQVANGANPDILLSGASGVVVSHVYELISEKVPAWARPFIPLATLFGGAFFATFQTGGNLKTASANGIIAVASSYITHATTFGKAV